MARTVVLAALAAACPLLAGRAEGKQPAAGDETGLVKVEVTGKLVRKDGRYCVEAKNPAFGKRFLVELVRTEDKNQALDDHIRGLEGQVVVVRGVLRFSARRTDGPELGIPIRSETQVRRAEKG